MGIASLLFYNCRIGYARERPKVRKLSYKKRIQSILSKPIRLLLATGFVVVFILTLLTTVIPFGICLLCGEEVNEP
jgi:hypothetical protein